MAVRVTQGRCNGNDPSAVWSMGDEREEVQSNRFIKLGPHRPHNKRMQGNGGSSSGSVTMEGMRKAVPNLGKGSKETG